MDDLNPASELGEIRSCLEGIVRRLEVIEAKVLEVTSIPQAIKYEEAARLLSCSETVIKEMIREKRLKPTIERVGKRKRVPMTEIFRLTATVSKPSTVPAPLGAERRAQKQALAKVRAKAEQEAAEADEIRALGKKLRRR